MTVEVTIYVGCDGVENEDDDQCEAEFLIEDLGSDGRIDYLRVGAQLIQRGWSIVPRPGNRGGFLILCPHHKWDSRT